MQIIYYPFPEAPFLSPEEVVKSFELKEGEKVLDFGAGSGFWSLPLAKAVGRTGHVFVTDAKNENLAVIKSKSEKVGLDNLSFYKAPYEFDQTPIQTKVDLILLSNIISEINEDNHIFKEVKKLAKDGTRLVIVDWKKDSPIGPKKERRIDEEDVIIKARKVGFDFKKLLSAGAHHTGLLFVYKR
jgi:ubiquinone/menaquinone biosynthesis C-methylase UbiE